MDFCADVISRTFTTEKMKMMKSKIQLAFGLSIFLCLCSQITKAQLFQTRADIIKEYGSEYTSGIMDDGSTYICYENEVNTEASGSYIQSKFMYFSELENGSEICFLCALVEPSSETNSNVIMLRKKFVEIDYMRWKDYETNILYVMVVEEGSCILSWWWDTEKK